MEKAFVNASVKIVNLGCSKNQVDAEHILGEFVRAGWKRAEELESASVIVINTCGFIEAAKEESIQEILEAAHRKNKNQKLVVAGCLSQRYMDSLKQEMPEADLWLGTYEPGTLLAKLQTELGPEEVTQQNLSISKELETCATPATSVMDSFLPRILMGEEPHHAYLKIAEGCNRICGFCAIPLIRGKQRSRSIADLVTEAQRLETAGVRELALIAQDLTYFGREKNGQESLEQLLKALLRETGIPWIRLMYAYPDFITDSLIDLMATEKRICKYLDMPIQHASDRILQRMRRNYASEELRSILGKVKTAMPGIGLRTTVLSGYPGESDKDHGVLLEFIEEIRFRHLGCFSYSDEDGTYAFGLDAKVSKSKAEKRRSEVMDLQQRLAFGFNEERVGQVEQVLLDAVVEGSRFGFFGRTEQDALDVDGRSLVEVLPHAQAKPGQFVKVQVTEAQGYDVTARML